VNGDGIRDAKPLDEFLHRWAEVMWADEDAIPDRPEAQERQPRPESVAQIPGVFRD